MHILLLKLQKQQIYVNKLLLRNAKERNLHNKFRTKGKNKENENTLREAFSFSLKGK